MKMKITARIFTLISLSLLFSCQTPEAKTKDCPPAAQKSDALIMSTLWLQTAPEAQLARQQAFSSAWHKLKNHYQHYKSRSRDTSKAAIVLDIDETVLDNSPYEARLIQFGESYDPRTWEQWVKEARAALVPGARAFLLQAEKAGLEIFYISNRQHNTLGPTLQNLQAHHLPFADSAHVLLKTKSSDKTARRQKVAEEHDILLLIGDQLGDFAEAHQIQSISMDSLNQHFSLIPNPMYGSFTRLKDLKEDSNSDALEAWKQKLRIK